MKTFRFASGNQSLLRALQVLTVLTVVASVAVGHPATGTRGLPNQDGLNAPIDGRSNLDLSHHIVKRSTGKTKNRHIISTRLIEVEEPTVITSKTLNNLKTMYTGFQDNLKIFTADIKSKLKSDAPDGLKYIDVVTNILTPQSSAFSTGNTNLIYKGIKLTFDVTKVILTKIGPFVKESEQDWLAKEKQKLNLLILGATISLELLKLEKNTDGTGVSSGLGGANNGVNLGLSSETIRQIQALLKPLL